MGLLEFDEYGRLYVDHSCEYCEKYPLESLDEPCLACGYSQTELIGLQRKVEKANYAIDLFRNAEGKEEDNDVREAYLQISSISLGDGWDTLVLADVNETAEIRELADLTECMVRVIFYPTVEDDE